MLKLPLTAVLNAIGPAVLKHFIFEDHAQFLSARQYSYSQNEIQKENIFEQSFKISVKRQHYINEK